MKETSGAAAHEIRRRTYLDALGITTHVSRYALPGAAPSRRLLRRMPAPDITPASAPVIERKLPSIERPAVEKKTPLQTVEPPRSVVKPVAPFSVMLAMAGSYLWLEELPHRSVHVHYTQLVTAMTAALQMPAPQWFQFDWPIHRNAQFDLGEDAARQGLEGYLQRQLGQSPCDTLIVLGEKTASRLGDMVLPIKRRVDTRSAWDMLDQPQLKAQAWRDLAVLR